MRINNLELVRVGGRLEIYNMDEAAEIPGTDYSYWKPSLDATVVKEW